MTDEHNRPPERPMDHLLEAYWDGLVGGVPAGPEAEQLDPSLARTVWRVRALDDAPPIDARFKKRLWEDLMHGNAVTAPLRLYPPGPAANGRGNGHTAAPPWSGARPRPHQPLRQIVATLGLVALIILALGAVFVFYRENQHSIIPAVQDTATPTPPATENWPMWGGNPARTRVMPGSGPQNQPVVLWTYPSAATGTAHVVADRGALADGVLYLPTATGLVALDAGTGGELWQVEGYGDTVVVDGDGLIVHGDILGAAPSLARLRRSDGGLVWTAEQGKIVGDWNPVVADGVGYTPSGNDFIAFDPATGTVLWQVPLAASASRGASIANGLAVLGDQQGTVYGISTAGGDVVWTFDTDATTIGHPSLANGNVYVNLIGGAQEAYVALDAATGAIKWRFVAPSGIGFHTAAVDATTVYLPCDDGTLYALDAATGAFRWQFQTDTAQLDSPALVGGTIYVATESGLAFALDPATGAERWRFQLDSGIDSAAIVGGGVYYLSIEVGTVYALGGASASPATGSPAATSTEEAAGPTTAAAQGMATVLTAAASPSLPSFIWATTGSGQQRLHTPLDVAVAPDGKVWVADIPGEFKIFDAIGNYLETWGTPGSGPGQFDFEGPDGSGTFVSFGPDGSLYVADIFNHRIQHFDKGRNFVGAWESGAPGVNPAFWPAGIAFEPDGTLIAAGAPFANDIEWFAADGTLIDRWDGSGTTDGPFTIPVDVARDPQGRLIVVEDNPVRVRVFDRDRNQIATLDLSGQQPPFWSSAGDVEVDPDGNIYVCDQNNALVRVFGPDLQFEYQWGNTGEGDARLANPGWMALGPDGAVYVTDDGTGRLVRFDLAGSPAAQPAATPAAVANPVEFVWTTPDSGPGALGSPGAVALDPFGRLWVANGATNQFFIYDLDGNLLETWGGPGGGDGQFNFCVEGVCGGGQVAFAPDGSFYVADMGNRRVQKFGPDRAFLRAWGSEGDGTGDGQFAGPAGIAVAPDGTVLVTDFRRNDVQRFDPDGAFLGKFGGQGIGDGQFQLASGIAVAPDGTVYVADATNYRVQRFDAQGAYLGEIGGQGTGDGQFAWPWALAFDVAGNLYVADQDNHRVGVFAPDGTYLAQWGSQGSGPGQFDVPTGIAVNQNGTVYVADYNNNRVQKFRVVLPSTPTNA